MNLLEHAKYELSLNGYDVNFNKETIESDDDYGNAIAKSVLELIEVFSKAGHTGFSGPWCLRLFNKLVNHKALSELTNNPDEWEDVSKISDLPKGTFFQNKRQYSCFSNDLVSYYDVDDPDNQIQGYDVNENGEKIYWTKQKPKEQYKMIKLKDYKELQKEKK